MTRNKIYVSENDRALLAELSLSGDHAIRSPYAPFIQVLKGELKQARVLPGDKMPADAVSINSKVWIAYSDSGITDTFTLVMPTDADGGEHISVMSPLGMALLGYRAGDTIVWGPVDRLIRVRVDRVAKPVQSKQQPGRRSRRAAIVQAEPVEA